MRNPGMSKLHYLLYALLIFALTGCGASNLANLAGTGNNSNGTASVTSKLVYAPSKSSAKTVASAPTGVTAIQVTITGSDANGKALPVVRGSIDTTTNQGTIPGIYPGKVTMVVKAMSGSVVSYEGFAIGVAVNAGLTTDAGTIVMSPPVEKAQDMACIQCHETTLDVQGQNLVADFKQSGHYTNSSWTGAPRTDGAIVTTGTGCAGCHGPSHNDLSPTTSGRCYQCHGTYLKPDHATYTGGQQNTCGNCHIAHNFKLAVAGCIGCHSVPQNAGAGYVNDNNGVRSITNEFSKWSHHVTGVTLNNAHCAACHLEGTIDQATGDVVVDPAVHTSGNKTHLRDTSAGTDADFAWDPANPNFTGMDNFCMSCHDADGAVSPMSVQIQAYINNNGIAAPGKTAGPLNPFGDTISNRYDKMQRPRVTNAKDQFATTNNSHHAVRGQRYSGRTRLGSVRPISSPSTFANNSSALLQGRRSTIYDAGNFNALYVPLGTNPTTVATTGLGDDSTLHCGDCHTVGQYKVGSSVNAAGQPTPDAIGAHGSNNEYLLRNTLGTDQRHTQAAYLVGNATGTVLNPTTGVAIPAGVVLQTNPNGAFLVCFNCHAFRKYGSAWNGTGVNGPHAGEYDANGRCNGTGNTIPFNGYTTGKATDGTQFSSRFTLAPTVVNGQPSYPGEQAPDFGNAFGIQCLNCHNSGVGNAYGGIHGSANNTGAVNGTVTGGAFVDGMGNTNKVERFLPGLNNAMYVPGTLGGVTGGTTAGPITNSNVYTYTTGGIVNDTNWEQKHWNQTATTVLTYVRDANGHTIFGGTVSTGTTLLKAGAGCYTLGSSTASSSNITATLTGPSVTGAGGAASSLYGTWGGCTDHTAAQGAGNHGFVKDIVRPITY